LLTTRPRRVLYPNALLIFVRAVALAVPAGTSVWPCRSRSVTTVSLSLPRAFLTGVSHVKDW